MHPAAVPRQRKNKLLVRGYFLLVLHTHLPFIRHPEYPDFLEEDWFYEAMNECYLPLLIRFRRLKEKGMRFRITMSLTPPLCNMLQDPMLMERYQKKLEGLIELTDRERHRMKDDFRFRDAARMYHSRLREIHAFFLSTRRNIIEAFKDLKEHIEVITCGATHGFFPLMLGEDEIKWQVRVAAEDYRRRFGRSPRGIWLPECGYDPRCEKYLSQEKIKFFFLDTHGILYGEPQPRYLVYAPVYTPEGLAAFARDPESSMQVWSGDVGYPGDFRYREFYRDVGYDAPYEYIKDFLHTDRLRRYLGLKYYRITGKVALDKKEPYVPQWAQEAASEHARNFHFCREKQLEYLSRQLDRPACVVAPFDTELFGHWWFEGPDFISYFIEEVNRHKRMEMITPVEYLEMFPDNQIQKPNISTWGDRGYNEVWINGTNDWVYRHLHFAAEKYRELAARFPDASGLKLRAMNQYLRELLLAQSSDWAFIITCNTAVSYAEKRTRDHVWNCLELYRQIRDERLSEPFVRDLEWKHNIFPWLDYRPIVR